MLAEQQAGQRAAPPLATGQPGDRPVQLDARQQDLDDLPQGGVGGPLVVGPCRRAPPRGRCGCRRSRRSGAGSRRAARAAATPGRRRAPRSPVITRSSVVLPSPLRPTMPIRSPAPTPRETSVSSGRTPYDLETRSRLSRLRHCSGIGHHVRAGDRAVGDGGPRRSRARELGRRWRARVVGVGREASRSGPSRTAARQRARTRARASASPRSGRRSRAASSRSL